MLRPLNSRVEVFRCGEVEVETHLGHLGQLSPNNLRWKPTLSSNNTNHIQLRFADQPGASPMRGGDGDRAATMPI